MKSTYEKVRTYLKKAHALKAKARSLQRQMPRRLGEWVLSKTKQPMYNKDGKKIVVTDSNSGKKLVRMRNLHGVDEFNKKYYIVKKQYDNTDTKEIINEFIHRAKN